MEINLWFAWPPNALDTLYEHGLERYNLQSSCKVSFSNNTCYAQLYRYGLPWTFIYSFVAKFTHNDLARSKNCFGVLWFECKQIKKSIAVTPNNLQDMHALHCNTSKTLTCCILELESMMAHYSALWFDKNEDQTTHQQGWWSPLVVVYRWLTDFGQI